jgi:hypothetical protein
VKAVFVELSPFERYRADYLDDDAFRRLQQLLMVNPEAGALIPGHGWVAEVALWGPTSRERQARRFASDLLLVECRLAVLVIHNLRQR